MPSHTDLNALAACRSENTVDSGLDNPQIRVGAITIQKPETPRAPSSPALTPLQARFVNEYLIDLNATRAYLRSHPSVTIKTAGANGHRVLKKAEIAAELEMRRAELQERTGVTAEKVITRLWQIASADARELIEWHVGACRYCYGFEHRYQRTEVEFERDLADHARHQRPTPDRAKKRGSRAGEFATETPPATTSREPTNFNPMGGTGFDSKRMPHADCPECHGRGFGRAHFKDTRLFGPQASALYAGVRTSREGVEMKMHSQMDALEKIARHLGLYKEDNKQGGEAALAALLALGKRSSLPLVEDPEPEGQ